MSHISVRLFRVGALGAVALVCGFGLTQQDSSATEQVSTVMLPTNTTTRPVLVTELPMTSRCGALTSEDELRGDLANLALKVEPTLSLAQANALARGALMRDVTERTPPVDIGRLGRATTICVVRHVNDDNEVVWRVEFPSGKQQEG